MGIMEIVAKAKEIVGLIQSVAELADGITKTSAVADANQKVLELQAFCLDVCAKAGAEREKSQTLANELMEAKQTIVQMKDERAKLAPMHPVRLSDQCYVYVSDSERGVGGEPFCFCANCHHHAKVGVLQNVGTGGFDVGRGRDVRLKCQTCGNEFLVLRQSLRAALGVG